MASKLTTYIQLEEVSAPTAESNNGALYVKADGHLYFSSVGGAGGTISETAVSLSPVANNTNNYVVTATGTGLNGETNMTFDGSKLAVTGEISGSGVLNVVGAATLESTLDVTGNITTQGIISGSAALNIKGAATFENVLQVTGAIATAAGVSGSSVSASYAHFNSFGLNQGGTNSITMGGDGTITTTGKFATSGEISGSGVLNIVGLATFEGAMNVTGAITTAGSVTATGAVSSSVGITGSSITINDTIELNANGNITKATSYSGSTNVQALNIYANNGGTNTVKLLGTGEISGSGPLNIVGAATFESTLNVTGAIASAANISSSAGVLAAKSVTFGHDGNAFLNAEGGAELQGNLYVSGNLVVNGTTTTVNSTTVTIDDPVFTIGGDTAPGSDDNKDRGIEFNYHNGSSALVGFMGWDDSATAFTFLHTATNSSEVFSGTEAALKAGEISGSGVLNIVGAATLESTLHVSGAMSGAVALSAVSVSANDKAKLLATGEISGSGPLNIVGAATLESTLSVTGAILSAANISSSLGVLGAKSVTWGHAGTAYLNAGGGAEMPGNLYVSGTLVAGTFSPTSLSASAGITGSSVRVNDTIHLNANGNITAAASISGSATVSALNLYANNGGTKSVLIKGDGTITAKGEISGSGVLNIVGAATFESTLNVTGAVLGAVNISSSAGVLAAKSVTFGHAAGGFLNVGGGAELPGNLYVSGSTVLGNANTDVVSVTSQLTASEGMLIPDLAHLRFGTTGDIVTMKYNSAAGYKNLHVTLPPAGMMLSATGTTEPVLALVGFHADATGPALQLCHFPTDNTAADDDVLGSINFKGQDSGNNQITYGYIQGTSADVTDGTEDGKIAFNILIGGGNFEVATINTTGFTLPNTASHGLVTAHSFVTYSDERLKENIKKISSPIDKIKQLRGVTYDWRHDGSSDIGFIAQEVKKVIPSVVYENKGLTKEHFGLDYPKMNALLVEAIKEQQKQIEDLAKVVKSLKKTNVKEPGETRKRTCSKCGREGHDKRSCAKSESKFERSFIKAKLKKDE